jgi:2,4-dienoyl-CoA reductase-like NADH-dependent reductase (Old Yellow Enzyme family)/thioredoxin reductase
MPPMGTRYATYGGAVTSKLIDYYVERARGGVGLIIVQFTVVSPEGLSSLYPLAIWDDGFVPGLRALTEGVHAAGAKVAIQLAHAGGVASSAASRRPVVGPSAVPGLGREVPRELSREGISRLRDAFGAAARRAAQAGFDAVELHMAHGYLLNQFLSPLFNRRTDEYGGTLVGRARFPLEVLRQTRQAVGDGMPVFCRLNAEDGVEGGLTLSEAQVVATLLERGGADVIDVSAGIGESFEVSAPPMTIPPGSLVPHAAAIKSVVGVPVVAVGRLHDPVLAERVLAEGKADLIAVGRSLIADPEWPQKAAEGRYGDICPCIACNQPECHGRIFQQMELGCTVNAAVGREVRYAVKPAACPRHVLIVGGGAAGLEAARVAALRGHAVTLCEQMETLGGQLWLAAAPPHKGDIEKLVRYLSGQAHKLGVTVRLSCPVTPALVAELHPEAIVLATGAEPLIPALPGAADLTVTAWDVLRGKVKVGDRVVVVGGGVVGCETAEYLAAKGRQVTILELRGDVAPELMPWTRRMLLERLVASNVEILLQAQVKAIQPSSVLYDRKGVSGEIAPVDTVVLACGARSRCELVEALRTSGVPLYVVGDASQPANIAEAIRAGFEVGYQL